MSQADRFDCTQCGACCQCFPIYASEADADREVSIRTQTRLVDENLREAGKDYQLYPLPFHSGCAFLKSDKLCRIYETRPAVCRRFEAGSDQCIEARQRLGIE